MEKIQTSRDLRTRIKVDSTDITMMEGRAPLAAFGWPSTGGGVEHVHVINKSSFPSVPLEIVDSSATSKQHDSLSKVVLTAILI